ncbi:zinc transporter [Erythrobacter sp. SCSIO 43205]|nr:zinc transporter [Erythrobacter sp. SCSIO 43205]
MAMMFVVIAVVSGALIIGALWGAYGHLGKQLEGFLVAIAGGALLLSVTTELIQPAIEQSSVLHAMAGVGAGALVFVFVDRLIANKMGEDSGGGLLAAITLDGIPENLALGVALIAAGPMEVAALAGSILLSNLPEAAGGARDMRDSGWSKARIVAIWAVTAAILSLAAIAGNMLLDTVSESTLAIIRSFAAGAVVASLATEVFPKAYDEDCQWAGIATAIGVILAFTLGSLGAG